MVKTWWQTVSQVHYGRCNSIYNFGWWVVSELYMITLDLPILITNNLSSRVLLISNLTLSTMLWFSWVIFIFMGQLWLVWGSSLLLSISRLILSNRLINIDCSLLIKILIHQLMAMCLSMQLESNNLYARVWRHLVYHRLMGSHSLDLISILTIRCTSLNKPH